MKFTGLRSMVLGLALIIACAPAGCNKSDSGDKDGAKKEVVEKEEAKGPDFGSMPEDLCTLDGLKKISMDVIDNQVFIVTDQENLWGGQTIEDMVEFAKSMAEGMMDTFPEPENCEVKGSAVTCDEALATLNKANGGAYDMDLMKKNMDTLGVEECGRLTQKMDFWGGRPETHYFVGRIGGDWKFIFTVSQMQLDAQDEKEKDEETSQ